MCLKFTTSWAGERILKWLVCDAVLNVSVYFFYVDSNLKAAYLPSIGARSAKLANFIGHAFIPR